MKVPFHISKAISPVLDATRGPRAICTGTLLPCQASNNCRHYGIHYCSTFKKHSKKACPHYIEHDFRCIRLDEGGSLEESIEST